MTSPNTAAKKTFIYSMCGNNEDYFCLQLFRTSDNKQQTPVPEFISYKLERFFFLPMKQYFRWNLLKVNAIFLYKNARYQ